ncbi:MAG: class I SAM-dependent methyltransferase [Nitriliruptoraceae bacterium]
MVDQVHDSRTSADDSMAEAALWLVSDDGRSALDRLCATLEVGNHPKDRQLALVTQLRRQGLSRDQAALLIDAATGRIRARERWPDADGWLFTREALEQASDPAVSAWRAERYAAASDIWDLCAGIGGDAAALARHAPVTAVESDHVRAILAQANLRRASHPVEVVVDDATQVRIPASAWVHADPGRRAGERRVRGLSGTSPGVDRLLQAHAHTAGMGIVVSPAVDWNDPVLRDLAMPIRGGVEVEFVQVDSRLVEATLWLSALRHESTVASATLIVDGQIHHRRRRGDPATAPAGVLGTVLVDVAAAAVRARVHDTLAEEIGARRISSRRALLTCDELPPASPWYRREAVEWRGPVDRRRIRSWLSTVDPVPTELVVHGLDVDLALWWRDLRDVPRGPQGRRIHLVRTESASMAIATTPVSG